MRKAQKEQQEASAADTERMQYKDNGEICVDLFTDHIRKWMEQYPLKKVNGKNGVYYTATILPKQKRNLLRQAGKSRIRYRCYEKRWARSATYRADFLRHNEPPYHCRYCGRSLSIKYVSVDHIVPVARTKKYPYARWLLTRRGIHNVNDIRNLAPSCASCNHRKGNKLGFWYIRGLLGHHTWFRVVYRIGKISLILLVLCLIYRSNFMKLIFSIF